MVGCEKCWGDAYMRYRDKGGTQTDHYNDLIKERKDNPCTPKEQAGQWWDEEKQIDTRLLNHKDKEQQ